MVFIITGTASSARNTVGRLLAEALGWDFVRGENLRPPPDLVPPKLAPPGFDARSREPLSRLETLSAGINFWIYEWRDVVVSCPPLNDGNRRQLSKMSSLVKIVCLDDSPAPSVPASLGPSASPIISERSYGRLASRPPDMEVLTVNSSRQVEEIVSEIVCVLVLKRRPPSHRIEANHP